MDDATRLMVGIMLLTIPTIEFGGYFLLGLLSRRPGLPPVSDYQQIYFRAGHAHAGVLVIIGLICQFAVQYAELPSALEWAVRFGVLAAPILVSLGFFIAVPRADMEKPNKNVRLIYTGALILAGCLIALGIGLLIPASSAAL